VLLAALVSATALAASPQQPAKPEAAPVFPSGTQAVVLDVVARDKKGRTVSDLRPEEIEVLEEGKPRTITGFRFVERAPLPPPAVPGTPAPEPAAGAPRHPTLVTLVFDSLDQQGRPFARNAALELLRADERKDLLFSVFYVGNRLQLLQQFTTDRQALAAAVDRACSVLDPRGVVPGPEATDRVTAAADAANDRAQATGDAAMACGGAAAGPAEIGRASCRERVSNFV
jgi:VWFA-related protein